MISRQSTAITLIMVAIALSYSSIQSQSISVERVSEIEASTISHLKSLLKSNYDGKIGFYKNVIKIPKLFNLQTADSVLERRVEEGYFGEDFGWAVTRQDSFVYNNQMLLSDLIHKRWIGSGWLFSRRYSFQYNGAGDVTEFTLFDWDDGAWRIESSVSTTYDDNGIKTEQLSLISIGIPFWDIFEYADSGLLISVLTRIKRFADWEDLYNSAFSPANGPKLTQ